jgi:hypothetical protein
MRYAMEFCRKSPEMKIKYDLFVKEMVFSSKKEISYGKALCNFSSLLERFVNDYAKGIDYTKLESKETLRAGSTSKSINKLLEKKRFWL